jgi:abequosyltransferase
MKHLLSICIPTHNRAEVLSRTLLNLLEEISIMSVKKIDFLEVCISDNGSTDETQQILENFKKKCPVDVYINKNDKDLGFDNNILNVVEISKAEFVWLFSDDDGIERGGINYVYDFLMDNKDIDILILSSNPYDSELRSKLPTRRRSTKNDIQFYLTSLEATLELPFELSLISQCVFRKSKWLAVENRAEYIGSWYVHVFVLLLMIKRGSKVAQINKPSLVRYRSFNSSLSRDDGYFRLFFANLNHAFQIANMLYGINTREGKLVSKNLVRLRFPPHLVAFQIMRFSLKERILILRKFIDYFKNQQILCFTLLPFFMNPLGFGGKILFLFSQDTILRKIVGIK